MMLRSHPSIFLLLLFAKNCLSVEETVTPQTFEWSPKSYGPDGPWHAVTINIGTPPQPVDLFPGGSWQSNILAPSVCHSGSSCAIPSSAGFYNSSLSTTPPVSIAQTGTIDNSIITETEWIGNGHWVFDTISVPLLDRFTGIQSNTTIQDFDMLVVTEANDSLPNGTTYPAQVGKLALGAPHFNQTWLHDPPNPNWNGTLITSALFGNNLVPSNSYGLHYGSPSLGVAPSLTIGGYDQAHVLGPVSTQVYVNDHLPIELLDISLGVAEGSSPFPFASKSGLLAEGNSSIGTSLTVNIEAPVPYLYLPKSTCEAITQYLPVTYSPSLSLYLWNTTSADYTRIITSPSYLAFTFSLNSSLSQNFTINLPFSLLNLTLTPPLVSIPTPYFPCRPAQGPTGSFELGRAFLQAAFIGVNWRPNEDNGPWFLAQAPGPDLPASVEATAIRAGDDTIIASTSEWANTWKSVWTVLPDAGGSTDNKTSSGSGDAGLSTSTKKIPLGSIIAAIIAALLFIGAIIGITICLRKKQQKLRKAPGRPERFSPDEGRGYGNEDDKYRSEGYGPRELATTDDVVVGPRELESAMPWRVLDFDAIEREREWRRARWTVARGVEMAG